MNENRNNVLLIASWFPSNDNLNYGIFIKEQADLLVKSGINLCVIHPYLLGSYFSSIPKNEVRDLEVLNNSRIIRVGIKPKLPFLRSFAYKTCLRETLKELKKNNLKIEDFRIIVSHSMFLGGYVAYEVKKIFGIPFVHIEHSSGLVTDLNQYNSFDKRLIRRVFSSSKKTYFVSDFSRFKTLENFNIEPSDKFATLHNAVNCEFFNSPIVIPSKRIFRYIIICSIIPVKNVQLLINAWRNVVQRFPNSSLTIAGEGPDKNRLIELAKTFDFNQTIIFKSKLTRSQMIQEISSCHVLVSSSKTETFGLTVAEAQAMGKPVVVTDSGGIRDIVEKETGIITKNSVSDLENGLINIQENYHIYDPITIRQKTKEKFDSNLVLSKLLKIIKE